MLKKNIWTFIRFFIGIFVLVILCVNVGWEDFFGALKKINLWYILPLFAISFVMVTISCIKWQMFLSIRNINSNIFRLMALYLIGYFFNNFLPGQYGGDVVRAHTFGRQIKSHVESFASVFMERFTGLSALVGMGLLASVINYKIVRDTGLIFLITLIVAGYLFFLLLIFSNRISKKARNIKVPGFMEKVRGKVVKLHEVIISFKNQKITVINALIISFLFHVMTIINTLVVCMALDIHVKILEIALIVPFVLLISIVPISINSIGIQEGAFVYFFSLVGVPFPAALSIALVLRAKNIVLALIGGALFMFWNKVPPENAP